jgi:hypothetical protein
MSVLPNAVGRLDAVVEAIREGDRERAITLLKAESKRLLDKKRGIADVFWKAAESLDAVWTFEGEIAVDDKVWTEARLACGWSGVDGFEGPVDPDSNHLSDYRVLKTAIEIARYAAEKNPNCEKTVRLARLMITAIHDFTEQARIWNGLRGLKPYRWGGSDRDCKHLIDDAYDAGESPADHKPIEDMIPAFEGTVETLPPAKPALKASEFPIGTVMVLGKHRWTLCEHSQNVRVFKEGDPMVCECQFWVDELQELVDRGVRFEIPEGGAK